MTEEIYQSALAQIQQIADDGYRQAGVEALALRLRRKAFGAEGA
jgi:hypothetical protein